MPRLRDRDDLLEHLAGLSMAEGPARAVDFVRSLLVDGSARPPDVTRADLLVDLGEYLELSGDPAAAGDAYTQAVADGSETEYDARAWLLSWCVRNGDAGRAQDLAQELRRSRPREPEVYLIVGEAYEEQGDLTSALRWFTAGMDRMDEGWEVEELAVARLRVRRELGFPADDDDEFAAEVLADRQARRSR